jgi:hypothetical protein
MTSLPTPLRDELAKAPVAAERVRHESWNSSGVPKCSEGRRSTVVSTKPRPR